MKSSRERWTKAQLEQLDVQIIDVLERDHPQSVRHAFYRATNPRLPVPVPKTERGYRKVVDRCTKLRRSGEIPYGWITDATRRGYHVATYDGPVDFLENVAGLYRRNLWTEDLPHVEVWCESRSIAGVLIEECQKLAVSLYPAGGFSSLSLTYQAATYIDRHGRDRAVVIYVGDYDPAGVLIDQSIENELRRHLSTPLSFRRLAINAEQIIEYDLPTKPRKVSEVRCPDLQETVEAEAMPAGVLRQLVRSAVAGFLPPQALVATEAAEKSERELLLNLVGEF